MRVSVCLTSGRTASVEVCQDEQICEVRTRAQHLLGTAITGLVAPNGVQLPGSQSIRDAGILDGAVMTGFVKGVCVASHRDGCAFAAIKSDGSVVTWGRWDSGGDSSAVRAQLASEVRQMHNVSVGPHAVVPSDFKRRRCQ